MIYDSRFTILLKRAALPRRWRCWPHDLAMSGDSWKSPALRNRSAGVIARIGRLSQGVGPTPPMRTILAKGESDDILAGDGLLLPKQDVPHDIRLPERHFDLPTILVSRLHGIRSVVLFVVLLLACASISDAIVPGDVEPGFNAGFANFRVTLFGTAIQPDGMIIAGGDFTQVHGQTRNRMVRMSANGTLDTGFNPHADYWVWCVAAQADGKTLIGGWFSTMGGVARNYIARVQPDGTLDTGFNPDANNQVYSIAVQADGKTLIGGKFTTLGGVTRNRIARLNADSTLDTAFDPNLTHIFSYCDVLSMVEQADGKILIGGDFNTVGGVQRINLARLNADGTLDTGFNTNTNLGSFYSVYSIAVQADGKILIGGDFAAVGGVGRNNIARLNADGTLDPGFNPNSDGGVFCMAVQVDGKILIGGDFNFVGGMGRYYIARLNANGTLDTAFNPNPDGDVYSTVLEADGKILVGGQFGTMGGVDHPGLTRLHNDAATQNLTVPNLGRVQWLRGGASPETLHVTFELSTDGGLSYIPLGAGTRMSGGWELTGLSLPSIGHIRARARIPGGIYNGSSSLLETVTGFGPNPNDQDNDGLLDSWELTYWPTFNGHNPQDDDDDDGYSELLELAFGLNPTAPDPGGLPPVITEGGYLTMTITKHAGVTYEVQSGGTLLPGQPDSFSAATTTVLINNATTLKVRDNFPTATSPPRFMRVKVTAAP